MAIQQVGFRIRFAFACLSFLLIVPGLAREASAEQRILMPETPHVSPDGAQIAFAWIGEIWTADIDGSNVTRLTNSDANEAQPLFSPDGESIAFISDRSGSDQIYVMQRDGSGVTQITYHTGGYSLEDWFPDGKSLLATGQRDHYHRDANRLIRVRVSDERTAEEILANAMAEDARVGPEGTRILFTREGERWWRKGYEGERSAQVWMLDLESGEFKELLHEGVECMWPNWMPDGNGFYFTKGTLSGFELWRYRFPKSEDKPAKQKKIAGFEDDSIVFPTVSSDGKTIVFRHLFDLYSLNVGKKTPKKLDLIVDGDVELPKDEMRREYSRASEVAFTTDGLEVAFVAGGDIWVMDTTLREPQRVTHTDGYEGDLVFSPDGNELWYSTATEAQVDIWKATRGEEENYWWQNEEFDHEQVTEDAHVEGNLRFVPGGDELVFQQGRGDLAILDLESGKKRILISGFSGIDYDLSFDGHWITYSKQDDDFNSEIWISKLDGSMDPVNVSRHPDNEYGPRFSPDGKILAFTGRRIDREVDIYYVYLQEEFDDETSRARKISEALELMKKKRKSEKKPAEAKANDDSKDEDKDDSEGENSDEEGDEEEVNDEPKMVIDFKDIHKRLRRISVPDSFETGLLFSPDGKKLAFNASIDGKRGWYTVEFPDKLSPKFFTSSTGSQATWSQEAGGILYSSGGVPAKLTPDGKQSTYSFEVAQENSRSGWLRAGFNRAWMTMREAWYDDRYANHNWDEVRRKYVDAASQMHDARGMGQVVQLMLGELNGSHLGFYPSSGGTRPDIEGWRDETAHLGVRFNPNFRGPGLLVQDVIMDGPADQTGSRLYSEDIILSIDGTLVDPAMDLTLVLNGRMDRDIHLSVLRKADDEDAQDEEIDVTIRPTSYGRIRSLLYEHWLSHNREVVDELSEGQLGYLHIRAMDMGSFYEFERELYNVGYGREGLVIDVRDNGGGSTTDLLLTALTQPRHAITVPRGGGQGYPHDRSIFATWSKPIIVLCNQNSYSNAEIFSHAIKTLNRGQVVGVQTAGGVISTGAASVNDVGRVRVPFRGWFLLNDGEDMERNGCEPNVVLWPHPGDLPAGDDEQLMKAVELLLEDVGEGTQDAELRYASERDEE